MSVLQLRVKWSVLSGATWLGVTRAYTQPKSSFITAPHLLVSRQKASLTQCMRQLERQRKRAAARRDCKFSFCVCVSEL